MNTTNTPTTRAYCCGNCPYFNGWQTLEGIQLTDHLGLGGECRRHEPPAPKYSSDKWPKMKPDEWCGDHPFMRVPDEKVAS